MQPEIRLTDEADYLLCTLYDAYLMRRKNGESAFDARIFGDSESIQSDYIPQWPTDDIDDAARELSRKSLVNCLFADDTIATLAIEREGISLMEHRFSDKRDRLIQRIATLRALIFG